MKIYLITHPATVVSETTANHNWKISKAGLKQVRNLGKKNFWKDVDFIFASSEQKAYNAARYWGRKHKIPVKILDGIEEMNRSRKYPDYLLPKKLVENDKFFYAHPNKSARGWETANHCRKRMVKTINRLIKISHKKNYRDIAVVSHGNVANIYVCYLKKKIPTMHSGQKKIGSWIVIDADRKKILTSWKGF